ncbi:hypothetical protein SNOUR_35700 [Streptomyces noursei ATCC 11455]|nr:hypothetical protein SNOUR_35700 [Streptomyces noursei ATCC 11455]
MIRIHFTAADFARVRFAPRPAPLQELNVALGMMCRRDAAPPFERWRQRTLRALPTAAEPFGNLVPVPRAPRFLDQFDDDLAEGLESVRATGPEVVRAEIERVYAGQRTPAPHWVHGLHRGDADAWRLLSRARGAAFEAVRRPVWPLIRPGRGFPCRRPRPAAPTRHWPRCWAGPVWTSCWSWRRSTPPGRSPAGCASATPRSRPTPRRCGVPA